jgi:hypothetical protein
VIVLGRIEIPAWLDFSDDRAIEHMRLVELDDLRRGDAHLLRICRENCRAILGPDIRPLAVELCRIMGDREIDLQHLAIADAARIKGNPDRLRLSGRVGSHHLVMRRVSGASGVTGDGAGDGTNWRHISSLPGCAGRSWGDRQTVVPGQGAGIGAAVGRADPDQ